MGTALLIAMLAALVAVIGLTVWGIRSIADAVPTPADLEAALAPEPYEEIGPTVVRSVRDLANLTTVELVEYTIVELSPTLPLSSWSWTDRW